MRLHSDQSVSCHTQEAVEVAWQFWLEARPPLSWVGLDMHANVDFPNSVPGCVWWVLYRTYLESICSLQQPCDLGAIPIPIPLRGSAVK